MDMPEKIDAERIFLEKPLPSFELAEKIFAAVEESRENIRPWLAWTEKTLKPEDSFVFLTDWCQKNWENKTGFTYLIYNKADGCLLGCIDLLDIKEKHKSGDIGYWIRSSAEGKGYMHEAVLALEKAAFDAGFNRITIGNDTRNTRSANVAARAGYHLDGVLRQNRWSEYWQSFVDSNVWSKLKSD